MATWYEADYRLFGNRFGFRRRYNGLRALLAIGFDLWLAGLFGLIGLAFAAVGFALWLGYAILVATARFLLELARLPLRGARRVARRGTSRPAKPAWAGFEEL